MAICQTSVVSAKRKIAIGGGQNGRNGFGRGHRELGRHEACRSYALDLYNMPCPVPHNKIGPLENRDRRKIGEICLSMSEGAPLQLFRRFVSFVLMTCFSPCVIFHLSFSR